MNTPKPDCPFCLENNLIEGRILAETDGGYLLPPKGNEEGQGYLLIPKQHAEALADIPDNWWQDVKALLPHIPNFPDQFNVNVNVGQNAGQSVKHLHFWIVPRVAGRASSGHGLLSLMSIVDGTAATE
jgi:Diadenosine tetraphosphate (Ap4A) hydrolase and other HIT family hydrolases